MKFSKRLPTVHENYSRKEENQQNTRVFTKNFFRNSNKQEPEVNKCPFLGYGVKAHKIQQELDPKVIIKNHVIVRYLRKYNIQIRAKQRSKNRSKASMIPDLLKWHATFRERCIRSNSSSPTATASGEPLNLQKHSTSIKVPCHSL